MEYADPKLEGGA